jgi:hypothetical protein
MLRGAALNSSYRSAKRQMGRARSNSNLLRGRGPGSYKGWRSAAGRTPVQWQHYAAQRTQQAYANSAARSNRARGWGGRSLTGNAPKPAMKALPGTVSRSIKRGGIGKYIIGGAIVGGAAFAAFASARRMGQDANKTLGNPATAVTSWTTYNRTNRGY